MRESASTDLREPQGSNPLGPPGPELSHVPCRARRCQSIVSSCSSGRWGRGDSSSRPFLFADKLSVSRDRVRRPAILSYCWLP